MSTDPVRRANLAAIACDSRPQLPDGFRRNSSRVGTMLGAARTGLSVYELPPGQAIGPPARVAMFSSMTPVGAVVYPDSDMIQFITTEGADDIVVKRSSAVDEAAPWTAGDGEAET